MASRSTLTSSRASCCRQTITSRIQHADELSAVHDRQMANAVFVHELLRFHHRRFHPAGLDFAGHEVADVHVGEPRAVPGEGADDIALGDDPDERPLGVADRESANVESAQAGADRGDRFFGMQV